MQLRVLRPVGVAHKSDHPFCMTGLFFSMAGAELEFTSSGHARTELNLSIALQLTSSAHHLLRPSSLFIPFDTAGSLCIAFGHIDFFNRLIIGRYLDIQALCRCLWLMSSHGKCAPIDMCGMWQQ